MNAIKRLLRAADRAQQGRPWLAVPIATWKKFGDDQAGNLAALIAYYAFASIFPLLLVLVTVLDIVLKHDPELRAKVLDSALSQYPVIGTQLLPKHGLQQTGLALAIGLILTVLAARGVASAAQNAMNSVWEVPILRRPSFPWDLLRSLGLILIIGPGVIVTVVLSSLAGGTGHVISGAGAYIAATAVSLVLNVGLFWLGLRMATASEVRTRELMLCAVLAAIAWQLLQSLGGYFIGHQLKSTSAYGVFGIVLGLLAWFYLQAQITLYVVELNVVRVHRLWPRSLDPPPLTDADVRAYELYARAEQRREEIEVDIRHVEPAAGGGENDGRADDGRGNDDDRAGGDPGPGRRPDGAADGSAAEGAPGVSGGAVARADARGREASRRRGRHR
ncbi:MAG TPA: YihY/virulence factor BrkB family protein [Streptosporangiaceae bacterium]|jgi:YihY family inner membrane protein